MPNPPLTEEPLASPGSPVRRLSYLGLLLAFLIPLYLTWTFDHSLWNPDETRDGGIAAEMYRAGDFAVPKLNGEAFLEKPPLYYWSCALVYKLTGQVTAGTTRLPSALFGMLGVVFTFLIGRRLFSERTGFWAAALLALSSQYFRMSHFAMMDVTLAAAVTGALYFYLKGSRLGFALLTVAAFYAKGFLGVILPGIVVTADLFFQKRVKEWLKLVGVSALVFAVLVAPWFWALYKEGGMKHLEVFVIDNHWKRFFDNGTDHTEHSFFYYFGSLPVDFLPGTLALLASLVTLARRPREWMSSRPRRFALTWLVSLLGFFTVSSSKRSIYLLPLLPAAALLSADWLDAALTRARPGKTRFLYGTLATLSVALMLVSFLFMGRLDSEKTFVPFTDAVNQNRAGRRLVGFDMSEMERGVIGFYTKGTFINIKTLDDLPEGDVLLMMNRNKLQDLAPMIDGKARLVFAYRPDKRTRSYLLYALGPGKDL